MILTECVQLHLDVSFINKKYLYDIMGQDNIQEFKIKEFRLKDIMPDSTILILGPRRTGKSFLTRDIFYSHRKIPYGIVFNSTESIDPFYSDFIPDSFIYEKYEPNVIQKFMNKQMDKVQKLKERGKKLDKKKDNVFIVLDDMLHANASWKKDETIRSIFFNGRHYNFFFILTLQYALGITPELRTNIDYVFIFNEGGVKNRRKIFEDYGSMFPSFDYFCNILDSCTENHKCLVIKRSCNSNKLDEQVFWFKAKKRKDFRVGSDAIWEYHDQHYNSKYIQSQIKNNIEADKVKEKFQNTTKLKVLVTKEGIPVKYSRH